ncbi:MAG: hypothetical protein HZB59_06865 [Ignavibacteriales bacterium]|nr:hypothetical protein [Ignavibacteriales bacterium]
MYTKKVIIVLFIALVIPAILIQSIWNDTMLAIFFLVLFIAIVKLIEMVLMRRG